MVCCEPQCARQRGAGAVTAVTSAKSGEAPRARRLARVMVARVTVQARLRRIAAKPPSPMSAIAPGAGTWLNS